MMNTNNANEAKEVFEQSDIDKNKTMAGLAYILFFLPLIVCPDSRYARFHANQGLCLFITSIAGTFLFSIIPFLGWFLLLPLFSIAVLVFAIIGLLNGLGGKTKELPLIGKFRLIK